MKNQKLTLVLGVLLLGVFLTGCGTMGQQTMGGSGAVQVTSVPDNSKITYIDYPSPTHDYLKASYQYVVAAGSNVKLYNNVSLTSLVSQQTADSFGMFTFDLGNNVAANDTVYLVVTEPGKQASSAVAFSR